jgi:hypothetical protein
MDARLRICQEHGVQNRLRNSIGVLFKEEILPSWLHSAKESDEVGRDAIEEAFFELFVLSSLEVPANAIPKRVADNSTRWCRLKILKPHIPRVLGPRLEV